MSVLNNADSFCSIKMYDEVAKISLSYYPCSPGSSVSMINYSENTTYRMDDPENHESYILRVSRPGYQTKKALESELNWMKAIQETSDVIVPYPIYGKNGQYLQEVKINHSTYHCVMFSFLTGETPDEQNEEEMIRYFEQLGVITAKLHLHTQGWQGGDEFHRPVWDFETMLGKNPKWGRWQDGLGITPYHLQLFSKVSKTILKRLTQFGKSPKRFGLIHADLRLANVIVEKEKIKVIDFDDCGYGWYLYDLATALNFIEEREIVPELILSWLAGYKKIRPLTPEEETEIPTFIMLRRLILVAWVGSHSDNETAQTMGSDFTYKTVSLAEKYLHQFG
ncbi:phosphotransferase enzyme family protein [Cytobacillus sp. Hz8]|uniref:phosphotransferase enzyme family protein n=1 Tax=Cytobacillus sp. Hz8 TaxID=3347168 RepID=UPI0035D98473